MLLRHADKKGLLLFLVLSLLFYFFIDYFFVISPLIQAFIAISISTYLVMLIDKIQAHTGDRRISERSLFIMTLFGGSVGMTIAMYTLRHKSRKLSFQIVVWSMVLVQLAILYYFVDLPFLHTVYL